MEILIVVLLVIIIYLLLDRGSREESQTEEKSYLHSYRKPAFTEDEWLEAVNAWYEWEMMQPWAGGPGFSMWEPPPYEEVKYDITKLEKLRIMAGLDKS